MIICHEHKIIFVKTKKVGGTSFEIALSKFCGPDDIITPITSTDEEVRKNLGFRTAQNYTNNVQGYVRNIEFFNHMTATQIREQVQNNIWKNYRKITIVRNPYEVLVSKYFWRQKSIKFSDFAMRLGDNLNENEVIAPLFGPDRLDIYLRYEDLIAELERNDLRFLVDGMTKIKAKGGFRPKQSNVGLMFKDHPDIIELVAKKCANTIKIFSYERPNCF